ncbi:MAG: EAL domain-containing protein [Pseudomonadota bacterium]
MTVQHILDDLLIDGPMSNFAELEQQSTALGITVANISDPAQPLIFVNDNFLRITEYERDEVIGRNCRFLQGAGTDQGARHRIANAISERRALNLTIMNYRRNGQEFWNSLSLLPARSRMDEAEYYVGLQFDASAMLAEHRLLAFLKDATLQPDAEELHRLSFTDHVTGLLNRHTFFERLALRSTEAPGAILLIDVDGFSDINDNLGHEFGDRVLKVAGQRVSHSLRNGDMVARIAADQFGVLLKPDTNVIDEAEAIAERVARSITPPITLGDAQTRITASVGIARFPEDGVGASGIVRNAEMALQRAKNWGGGSVVMYEPIFRRQQTERHRIALDLREALKEKRIEVHMQPQINLQTGELYGFEALARWPLPDGTWRSPGEFVPIAEDMGLIDMLGSYVAIRSFEFISNYNSISEKPVSVAINVSADQMRDMAFANWIIAELGRFDIKPEFVTIELTENILIDRLLGDIMENIQELNRFGVRVALDDFGTGWASLSHLQRFPIDYIKIDRSFVTQLENDQSAICRAVIDIAGTMGKGVIAEGVETKKQLKVLQDMGCTYVQGFLFGKPMPCDDVFDWMANYEAERAQLFA